MSTDNNLVQWCQQLSEAIACGDHRRKQSLLDNITCDRDTLDAVIDFGDLNVLQNVAPLYQAKADRFFVDIAIRHVVRNNSADMIPILAPLCETNTIRHVVGYAAERGHLACVQELLRDLETQKLGIENWYRAMIGAGTHGHWDVFDLLKPMHFLNTYVLERILQCTDNEDVISHLMTYYNNDDIDRVLNNFNRYKASPKTPPKGLGVLNGLHHARCDRQVLRENLDDATGVASPARKM